MYFLGYVKCFKSAWQRILEILPHSSPSRLTKDEVSKTRFAVQKRFGVECSENDIDDVWHDLYPTRWINDLQYRAVDCKRCYRKFRNGQICKFLKFEFFFEHFLDPRDFCTKLYYLNASYTRILEG